VTFRIRQHLAHLAYAADRPAADVEDHVAGQRPCSDAALSGSTAVTTTPMPPASDTAAGWRKRQPKMRNRAAGLVGAGVGLGLFVVRHLAKRERQGLLTLMAEANAELESLLA